jgi:Flp pilus assembly pilin Flp
MDRMTALYVRISERIRSRFSRGQTMTEYALILSAVGMVVFSAYKSMGNTIKTLLTTVDGDL